MDFTVSVFTLNCWGIPVVSKNRKERIEAISLYLNESNHNIVCLQEIWSENDYIYLRDALKNAFPFSHYFYSGVLGSGLCVFSKWKIQDVFFHQWPLNGYIHKVHHGDWFGGKGVGLCRIRHNNMMINVYCTHLHAEYNEDDIYLAHRVLQAYETADFVNLTTMPADISILAGDLNTGPGDLSFKLISQLPGLLDPYDLPNEAVNPSIRKCIGTSENFQNSYSDPKQAQKCPDGKRIDHILFHVKPTWEAQVLNFGNPLSDRVPGQSFSYSDHEAVTLELSLRPTKAKRAVSHLDHFEYSVIDEAIRVCKDAQVTITKSKKLYLTSGGLLFMFLIGTVGFWPNNVVYDLFRILLTAFCFYCIVMGSLWNKIEMNSLKAGLSGLENFLRIRNDPGKI